MVWKKKRGWITFTSKANGTQGRLLYWHPTNAERRKAVSATFPELVCRFAKESSKDKPELLSEIDFLDVTARAETLNTVPGAPVQLQLGVVPSYALTTHKTQALSGA